MGTGSRVHTFTGLQGEPRFPPPGGAGHARCPASAPAPPLLLPPGPGSGQSLLVSSACNAASGHTGAAESSMFRGWRSSSWGCFRHQEWPEGTPALRPTPGSPEPGPRSHGPQPQAQPGPRPLLGWAHWQYWSPHGPGSSGAALAAPVLSDH